MQRAVMIVNPKAGRAKLLAARHEDILRVFAEHDFAVDTFETTAEQDSAARLAKRVAECCDLVVACGGDGTVHGVLQGVANSNASLGVLPLGTANALARSLKLPLEPVAALRTLLNFEARDTPLGLAVTEQGARWFTVMVGAGPDGQLVHEMKASAKVRWGRASYYTEAARLFLMRTFPAFLVAYRKTGSEEWEEVEAVSMMASRVSDLGGLFGGLTANSRLHHAHLVVQLLTAPAYLSLPAWIGLGRSGLRVRNPWLTTVEVEELRCSPLARSKDVFAQVDGEGMGRLPLRVRMGGGRLRLLMPRDNAGGPTEMSPALESQVLKPQV